MAKANTTGEMPGDSASASITPTPVASTGGAISPRTIAFPTGLVTTMSAPVAPPVTGVNITEGSITLAAGSTHQLAAISRDARGTINTNPTVSWSSDRPSVATVSASGLVTAVSAGTASIYASVDGVRSLNDFVVQAIDVMTMTIFSGNGQSGTVGTVLAQGQVVEVKRNGVVAPGVVVMWEANDDDTIAPQTPTGILGRTDARTTLGPTAGSASFTASLRDYPSVPEVTFLQTAVADVANKMQIDSSTDQQGANVSTALPLPPAVYVFDQYNNPVSGKTVTFAVTGGGGAIVGGSAVSDANGRAAPTSWTMGASAGTNTCTATAAGLTGSPITFTANGIGVGAGVITQIATQAGTGQTGIVAGQAAAVMTWRVRDGVNVAVQGALVTFSVTAGGGSLSVGSAVTNASGDASVTLTTGTIVALNTVLANVRAGDGTTLGSSISTTTVAGTATKLGITTHCPPNSISGQQFNPQPVVQVQDQYGNAKAASKTITAATNNGSIVGTATAATNASTGAAAFSNLGLSGTGACVITFSTAGLTSVLENAVTLAPPLPATLGMVTQPTSVTVGATLSPVAVDVRDQQGTRVTSSQANITVALSGNGVLSGTLTVQAVSGVATFSDLAISAAGTGDTLIFTSVGLATVTSTSFNVNSSSSSIEPAGFTQITSNPWNRVPAMLNSSGQPTSTADPQSDMWTNWKPNLAYRTTIVPNPGDSRKVGASNVLDVLFPQGLGGGGAPSNLGRVITPSGTGTGKYKRLYIRYWLRVLTGFTTTCDINGVPNAGNITGCKQSFLKYDPLGYGDSYINLFQHPLGQVGYNLQGKGTDPAINGNHRSVSFNWSNHFDEWHYFEWILVSNTVGQWDGTITLYIDHVNEALTVANDGHDQNHVKFWSDSAPSTIGFDNFSIEPTYGGAPAGSTVNHDMHIQFDDVYISGSLSLT